MKPNFSGVWKLDVQKSDFGFLAPVQARVDEIAHADETISIVTTQHDANGKVQVERRLQIGGDPVSVEIRGRARMIRAWWEQAELVVETASDVSGNARRIEDRWSMTAGGDAVIVMRRYDMPGGAVQQRLVFYAGLRLG